MSKTLTAVRHAKSSWSDPLLEDLKRPLNSRGKRAAPAMGRYLHDAGQHPDLMISSPAKRARKTAVLMAREFGYQESRILIDERLYFEGSSAILQMVQEQESSYENIYVFSHEPVISEFCELMCGLHVLKYPTAAACSMTFQTDSWQTIQPGQGQQLFFVKPKAIDPTL